jgi:hypothetical protein
VLTRVRPDFYSSFLMSQEMMSQGGKNLGSHRLRGREVDTRHMLQAYPAVLHMCTTKGTVTQASPWSLSLSLSLSLSHCRLFSVNFLNWHGVVTRCVHGSDTVSELECNGLAFRV